MGGRGYPFERLSAPRSRAHIILLVQASVSLVLLRVPGTLQKMKALETRLVVFSENTALPRGICLLHKLGGEVVLIKGLLWQKLPIEILEDCMFDNFLSVILCQEFPTLQICHSLLEELTEYPLPLSAAEAQNPPIDSRYRVLVIDLQDNPLVLKNLLKEF